MPDIHKASALSPALPVGTMLGNYIVREVIGSGGFGITYLAQEEITEKLVVIKENYPADISFRDMNSLTVGPAGQSRKEAYDWALTRFLEEAKILSRLSHPNIVPIRNAFKALGTAYYVMPHVEGTELQKAAPAPRNITAEWLLPVLEKILSALGYLHAQGLIHRDIKPNNILMNTTGEPILIDFGTARALESTHSHTHIGTPGFMPFEQLSARGKRGPWTDFYALGATCYYLITGELPPHSVDRMEEDEYLPLAGNPSLTGRFPEHVLSSIDKALIMNRSKRWQSAQEWLDALKDKSAVTSVTIEAVPLTEPVNQARPEIIRTIPTYAQAVDELERLGISSDTYNDNLLSAAEKGEAHMTALLLAAGAGVNTTDEDGYTPLLMAVTNGHTECVRLLLTMPGIDVNQSDIFGRHPLLDAAASGHTECVRLLLSAPGININKPDQWGLTPLSEATFNGNTECADLIRAACGISPQKDNSSLYAAARDGEAEQVRRLLAAGTDVNMADENGRTPLHFAANLGHVECLKLLLAAPRINVNMADNASNTPLIYAAEKNHTECVRLLLAAPGIDVNRECQLGATPLIWAAVEGHTECVRPLLNAPGIDVNKEDDYVFTPLSEAARLGHTECVRLLLAAPGIDVNKEEYHGVTPLDVAAENGHTECVRLLLAAPGIDVNKETPLLSAAYKNHTECMRFLLATPGIDVNKADHNGWTPLHWTAYKGQKECVRLLLASPKIDVNKENLLGRTPLFWALENDHTECAELIRAAGGRR